MSELTVKWAIEAEFKTAELEAGEFKKVLCCPDKAATVDETAFVWRIWLYPNGAKWSVAGVTEEVRDHMGCAIKLVDGPTDSLAEVKNVVFVYKSDGSRHEVGQFESLKFELTGTAWGEQKSFPTDAEKLKEYLLGEAGREFVRVRFELTVKQSNLDALRMLPPPPMASVTALADRMVGWQLGDSGTATVVASDDKQFHVHRDQLTQGSVFFERLFASDMEEGKSGIITIAYMDSDVLAEVLYYMLTRSVHQDKLQCHLIKILEAAERFGLGDLKIICERAIVKKLKDDDPGELLELLGAAETFGLRVALNAGLCRLFHSYERLSADDKRLLKNDERFAKIHDSFALLASQSSRAVKLE